jgi:hypothetical protein
MNSYKSRDTTWQFCSYTLINLVGVPKRGPVDPKFEIFFLRQGPNLGGGGGQMSSGQKPKYKGIFVKPPFKNTKFPLTPMGVLALGSAHARPSAQPPINVSGNFPPHVSAESPSNISPNPSEVISEVSEP